MKKLWIVVVVMTVVSLFWIVLTLVVREVQLKKYEMSLRTVAQKITSQMSDEQLVREIFILHSRLEDIEQIKKLSPGALFLYRATIPKDENGIDDTDRLQELMETIHQAYLAKNQAPPMFTIDQEWGYMRRLQKGMTDFPSAMALGEAIAGTQRYDLAMLQGFYTCIELRRNGIQWPFVPVVDVQTNPDNPVIGVRSMSSDAQMVSDAAEQFLKGLQTARCMGTMKHFPGHGDTSLDSHTSLPVVERGEESLEQNELAPYKRIIMSDEPPRSIMSAHIIFSQLSDRPATLSPYWLKTVLKEKWGYGGIVVTDDLEMNAVKIFASQNKIENIPLEALVSGADMLLLLTNETKAEEAIQSVLKAVKGTEQGRKLLLEAAQKVIYYKLRLGVMDRYLKQSAINWSAEEIEYVNMILAYSLEEEENIRSIEGQLAEAGSVNEFISENAIKTLIGAEGSGYPSGFDTSVIFTDLPENHPAYARLTGKRTVYPLENLRYASCTPRCSVLHTGQVSLMQLLQWKNQKKNSAVIFSVADPFPAKKYRPMFNTDDVFVTSFSNTNTSVQKLVEKFLSGSLPPKAAVTYPN